MLKQGSHIVIIGLDMGLGGAERVFSELGNEWVKIGYKVTIIQSQPDRRNVENYALDNKISVIKMSYPDKHFRRIRQTIELVKILNTMEEAVVIAFMPQTKLLVALGSHFISNKIVFTERNDPSRNMKNGLQRLIRDWTYNFADIHVFQTQQAKSYFSKRIQDRGYIIPNPINPTLPLCSDVQRRKTVVAAARLSKQKNLSMLIDAFSIFHRDYPDYTLEIYGKGSLEDELNRQILANELQEHAKLMGYSYNIYTDMKDCMMYVSSSDYEGISNSMLEALGMGIPTICTDCPAGGARETIEDGINGLLIPVGDTEALVKAMKRIASDPDFAEKLSKNAVKIREELSVNTIANKWLEVLDT